MKNNLIERYIYAVVRHLPHKIRTDVKKEIDGLISEMLDKRCGDNPPTEKDIKIVLLELGTPEELAAKYSGGEKKFLISGVYFINYKRVLKMVIPIVSIVILLGMIVAAINELATSPPDNPVMFAIRLFGQVLGGVIGGAWQSFAIITVVFATMERFKASMNSYGDGFLDVLPEAPDDKQIIKSYEPIFGIIMSVAVAVLFLGVPQIMGGMLDGTWTPLFDVGVLRSFWIPIIAWAVLGIIYEAVALAEGRYTKRLAAMSILINLLIIGCAAVVFLQDSVLNPTFVDNINVILNHEADALIPWLSHSNIIAFAIICSIGIIESVSIVVKAWKYGKSSFSRQ